ncbi:MAG: hypothetical protein EOM12_08930 [Verrucomicrobiae bacterium]|nr:hypothetical protein [Verrucomicrobiae bacterium]
MDEKIGVIFDTNSYRNFVKDCEIDQVSEAVRKLREKENEAGIKVYSSIIVGLELLGSLVEQDDGPNFKDCLKGIIALGIHCFDEEKKDLRIIPDARLLITGSFFPDSHKKKELVLRVRKVGGVICDIKNNYEDAIKTHKSKGTFSTIKKDLISERNKFLDKIKFLLNYIKEGIKKNSNENENDIKRKTLNYINSDNFKESISLGIISSIQNNQKKENEIYKKAKILREKFLLSVEFFRYILYKIIKNNIDLNSNRTIEERANWIWDYNISFHISDETIDDRKIIIITSDKDMIDIFKNNSFGDRIMNLEEYRRFINIKCYN